MNTLKIMTVLSLITLASPSFADAPRVGDEQVKTTQEKDNTAEMKSEVKVKKEKKLAKGRKKMAKEREEKNASGTHDGNSQGE